jgi:hypothetical protein
MKWNEMKWNEMKWNEMKWNETACSVAPRPPTAVSGSQVFAFYLQ